MNHRAARRLLVLAVFGLAAAGCAVRGQPVETRATTQLPRSVRPIHYDVFITPDSAALTFQGQVAIAIEVLKQTDSVTLNAADLVFRKVALSGTPENEAGFGAARTTLSERDQTATFTFEKPIPPGRYELVLEYEGRINTQPSGLFAVDYETSAGPKRALYTQFESAYARSLIPCWDEPAHKATFSLEADVANGQMAVSNMPVAGTQDLGGGRSRIRFGQTPKMSTYLLFFAVGDFERATVSEAGTTIGVVTRRGLLPQAQFVLQSSKKILREYNDYFAIPYALPKLDNIAAPGRSQQFGAMENWGAILTFEYAILLDPSIATQADKQFTFQEAAHEMAHQWFGNLVTMQWWDDLWLNEGFASWMESRTTSRLHPEWNTALEAIGSREWAMELDALATTHPVVQHVETVEQADQAFDGITYAKGEAVIRMLEGYVGSEAWRAGVREYIRTHAYGNTVSDDLWRAVAAAAAQPVAAIAGDFTRQPGVPLIRVEAATCENDTTALTLVQGEFSKDQPDKRPLRWRVPVIVAALGAGEPVRTLVSGGRASVGVPGCGPLVVNAGQSGYYRTLYGPEQLARITARFSEVAPIDQLGILSDSWSLGLAGLQPVTDVLDLANATPVVADPQVWRRIATVFESIDDYYRGDALRQATFRRFAIASLAWVFARIGWMAEPEETGSAAILRNDLIRTLGALGDPAVIAEARRRYAAEASDPSAVPAALRKTILRVVARHADAAMWDELRAAAMAEKTPLLKDQLYARLASAEDESLARRALDLALTDEPGATNSADMIRVVSELYPDLAFDFALGHLAQVMDRLDTASKTVFLPMLAGGSADPAMIGKIEAYAAAHLAPGSRRAAETAAAEVAYRVKIRTGRLPAIDAWLARNTPSS